MKKTNNNCYYIATTPTARRACAPCEPKKPKGAFAPCDDFDDEPVIKKKSHKGKKKNKSYRVRLDRDPYNTQDRRHRTSHGYRLAAKEVTELLSADAVSTELEYLREKNAFLRDLLFILDDGLNEEHEWSCLQEERIADLKADVEMAEADAAYWRSQVEEYRGDADYWYHKYSALRAELLEEDER